MLTTAGEVDVVDQAAILSWTEGVDGGPGTSRMLIDVRAVGQVEAGARTMLLIATPTMATIAEGSSEVVDAVIEASAPEIVTEERWWPDLESFGGRSDEEVAAAVATYPIAAEGMTSYEPEPADGWITWLGENGFQLSEQDIAIVQRYAGAGWALATVAVDIPAGTVNGGPGPIEVSFSSDAPVIPMVISSANSQALAFTSYVLASTRMDRSDSLRGNSTAVFSGPVTAADYPELAEWLTPFGGSAVLTKAVQTFPSPVRITEDVTFAPSDRGPTDAGTETKTVDRIIFALPAGVMLVAIGMVLLAVLGIVASRVLQRRYRDG